MNYKQNEKINQVKESTLVVGIDVGSTTQYARAFDWRGIELGKVFTFSNSREGFESFKAWKQRLQDKYKKSDAIVGIERQVITGLILALILRMRASSWLWLTLMR